jgi:2-polyprenyl-3-methyl-5-hydroxy-6-metoxy-1,4-benzoquinol methylase
MAEFRGPKECEVRMNASAKWISTPTTDGSGRQQPGFLGSLMVRWGRLGFTDIFHENVVRRGRIAQLFLLLFGTPNVGSFANGIYLKRILRKRRFRCVLDAGCGDGTFAFYLASKCHETRVLGVDIGEQGLHGLEDTLEVGQRIQKILQLPNLLFERADLRELDMRNVFDLVYSFDVLEHIAENNKVIENLHRSLEAGGLLLLRIPTRVQKRVLSDRFTAEHMKWAKVEHLGQHHDMESLLEVLQLIGFRIISADYTMGFWGRLSFELSEGLKYYGLPAVLQYACIPMLKALRRLDTLTKPADGDGLLVLCEKPAGSESSDSIHQSRTGSADARFCAGNANGRHR